MENILNMEYSLNAIQYLVELQIAEKQPANHIYLIETYSFCNGIEYKREVSKYLLKYNNDFLKKVLNNHLGICNAIIEKFNNELRFFYVSIKDKKKVLDYNIYCTFGKNTNFPFEELKLIRVNNGGYERGNTFIEDYRFWETICNFEEFPFCDFERCKKYYNMREKYNSGKMTDILLLVEFANCVRSFLNDYVPEIETLQVMPTQPTQPPQLHFTRSFTDTERQNLFNGLVSGGFIPKDTNIDHFNFVFGGTETTDFKQLNWQRTVSLLAYFIDTFFGDTDKTDLWKKTENCFTIKTEKPKINTLKNTVSKYKQYKEPPKCSNEIDVILKNL